MVGSTEDVDPEQAPKVAATIFGAVGVYAVREPIPNLAKLYIVKLWMTDSLCSCRYSSSFVQAKHGSTIARTGEVPSHYHNRILI